MELGVRGQFTIPKYVMVTSMSSRAHSRSNVNIMDMKLGGWGRFSGQKLMGLSIYM